MLMVDNEILQFTKNPTFQARVTTHSGRMNTGNAYILIERRRNDVRLNGQLQSNDFCRHAASTDCYHSCRGLQVFNRRK